MIQAPNENSRRVVFSVWELTQKIKLLLENSFPFIWITGEISNFRIPSSGHYYFTLKDEKAQINALMFKGQNRNLNFKPGDGMSIVGLGRLSLYEPRGSYQIILEHMEPKGIGALQIAYEQLKQRLMEEGLFDEQFKKPLPFLPRCITLITSPSGAVVHDFIRIATRRFENIPIRIIGAKVQGEGSEEEIIHAIEFLNSSDGSDIAVLARGGGSLEDFHAFNSEKVARAIYHSKIPIVSAVGHETDFTIADFVADFRAPTPSAAAEIVVPLKKDLILRIDEVLYSLNRQMIQQITLHESILAGFIKRLKDPRRQLADLILRNDDYTSRLIRGLLNRIQVYKERLEWKIEKLHAKNPLLAIDLYKEKLELINYNILKLLNIIIDKNRFKFHEMTSRIHDLSPLGVLKRGYSITRILPKREILLDPVQVQAGDRLEVVVSKGIIHCQVEGK